MLVEALQAHGNRYGESYFKVAGDDYEIPHEATAQNLIDQGIVKPLDAPKKPLAAMTKAELQAEAALHELPYASGDTKAMLIEAIETARVPAEPTE